MIFELKMFFEIAQFCFHFQSFRLPHIEVRKLQQVHDSCQADRKTHCDEDILRNLVANQNDRQAGIHMLCMAEKAGLMEHNGSLNVDVIKKKIALGAEHGTSVDALVTRCARSKNTAESTAIQMWICFVKNDIHYYHRL